MIRKGSLHIYLGLLGNYFLIYIMKVEVKHITHGEMTKHNSPGEAVHYYSVIKEGTERMGCSATCSMQGNISIPRAWVANQVQGTEYGIYTVFKRIPLILQGTLIASYFHIIS